LVKRRSDLQKDGEKRKTASDSKAGSGRVMKMFFSIAVPFGGIIRIRF
jgi:hypothetical protein